jgi:SAM-dependent methyltransferase
VFSDADTAALYDVVNPWDAGRFPADAFYEDLVMRSDAVLDVGCGTGAMLHRARERGHRGRLAGLDPDRAALDRARRRTDIEWVSGTAADARWDREFDLVTMTSHAFQFLGDDDEMYASAIAVRAALRGPGRFVFETRHPQARAWEAWNPSNAVEVIDAAGRRLRCFHDVESVDGDTVTFTETTSDAAGTVLRINRTCLRFLGVPAIETLLTSAGFTVESFYGDWACGPITGASREIVVVASRD